MNASTRLSMNGKSPMISTDPPFVLRLSKDERRVFQRNHVIKSCPTRRMERLEWVIIILIALSIGIELFH